MRILSERYIAPLVIGIVVSLYALQYYQYGGSKHELHGWFVAGLFVLVTMAISLRQILQHLNHWYMPNVQKYVVRIVWMIPLYSIESWLSLRFRSTAVAIEILRECYEAYALYSFLYFLIALLGDEQQLITILKHKSRDQGSHFWPLHLFFSPWEPGANYLFYCKYGVLQYVFSKYTLAVVAIVSDYYGMYSEGEWSWSSTYGYICFLNNMSQLWALYCLSMFYCILREELQQWRPLGKFACIKSVIFFTWWQAIGVGALVNFVTIPYLTKLTPVEAANFIQDYLICIEMLIAAIAYNNAFSYKDYMTAVKYKDDTTEASAQQARRPLLSAFLQSSVPDEMISDIKRIASGGSIEMEPTTQEV